MEADSSSQPLHFAIIVAGGGGKRMQSSISKQFMLLWDKPVLMHTLLNFVHSKFEPIIILVLPEEDINTWELLSQSHTFHGTHLICQGGNSRAESVLSGLNCIATNFPEANLEAFVAIHDGVRPLAAPAFIDALYEEGRRFGNAIPVLPCRDSVRIIDEHSDQFNQPGFKNSLSQFSHSLNRESLRLVQTPQVFKLREIDNSYRMVASGEIFSSFTDDASIAEACGIELHLSEGSFENIKITYPDDLLIAQALMGRK